LPVSPAARIAQRAITAERPFSTLSACKALLWCNQIDVVGNLLAGGPQYNYDSCKDTSQPGCLNNVQSEQASSVVSHSQSFDGVKVRFDENSASSIGGYFRYSSITSVTTAKADEVGDSGLIISGAAYDTLYPKSKTLPKGSQVKVAVTLALTPATTKVDCDPLASSTGTLSLVWGWVTPPTSYLSVTGECDGDTFTYLVADGAGNESPGTGISETFTVAVGKSYRFGIGGVVGTGASVQCTGDNCPAGTTSSELTGTWNLKIRVLTKGATFTTASGFEYDGPPADATTRRM
jgi:hypothetical protein